MPLGRYTVLTFARDDPLVLRPRRRSALAARQQWEEFHDSFRYADYAIIALVVAGVAALVYRATAGGRRRRAVERSAEGVGR